MKRSDIDQRFLDEINNARYPSFQPEDMAVEAAAGMPPPDAQPTNLKDVGMAVADVPAGLLKGAVQGTVGLPGDIESLVYGVKQIFNRGANEGVLDSFLKGLEQKTILPTTENVKKWLDTNVGPLVPEGASEARKQAAKIPEFVGELGGAGKTVVETAKAAARPVADVTKSAINLTKDLPVGMSTKNVGAPIEQVIAPNQELLPNVVSTRLPTAVKATEDPMTGELLSDLGTMKRDQAAFEQNISLVREYPNFVSKARNTEKRSEDFIEHVKDNLLYLYDQVPEATRNRSRLWYDGARNIVDRWGNEYGQPDQALAGVLAVLSPQKDWFMNVSLGNRVVDIALNKRGFQWDSAMDDMASNIWKDPKYEPVLALVRGKRYEDLQSPAEKALWLRTYDQAFNAPDHRIVTPEGDFADVRLTQSGKPYRVAWGSLNEIGKAVSILDNPSLDNISTMLGSQHKVRNFYNNIYAPGDPRGHVTIDTHAVAAGLLRPLSGNSKEVLHNFGSGVKGERGPANSSVSGAQGTYGIYAEAYRRAAQERGVLPREMQSITWEAVRGLFPDTFKTPKNAQQIDNIWLRYRKGRISLDEARNEVIRSAGGINPPEWQSSGLRGGAATEGGSPANQGELPGAGVPGGSASGSGRGQPTAGNTTTVKRGQAPATGAK